MTETDRQSFAQALAACVSAYREEGDEALAEGYWLTLSDLPLDRVKDAIVALMRTSKFMPRASEIREIVVDQLGIEARAADRETRIVQDYSVALAGRIIRTIRQTGADEATIRERLKLESERLSIEIHWPGEEPWNQRDPSLRLQLRRA